MSNENALASSSRHPQVVGGEDRSSKKSKKSKDKHHQSKDDDPSSTSRDKDREHKKDKHKSKDKSKHKHKHSSSKDKEKSKDKHREKEKGKSSSSSSARNPFEHRTVQMRMSIPPKYTGDWIMGARDVLDSMVMRYIPQVQGVLLSHWNERFLDDTLSLIGECPYGVGELVFEAIVWAPKIGQKLYGSHSLSSPSHLSLLFSKTFNISIPLQHIPQDEYIFEHTSNADLSDDDLSDSEAEEEEEIGFGDHLLGVHEVGRWRHKSTGLLVGEGGKGIKFTVIGMQVTNQMLSLTGSLLADPSNPPPPPSPSRIALPPSRSPTPEPILIDEPTHISKKSKITKSSHTASKSSHQATNTAAAVTEAAPIDERYLSARELKQKRKDEAKAKRDERKNRKEEREIEEVQHIGGEAMVGISEGQAVRDIENLDYLEGKNGGKKRKAGEEYGEGAKKKRKEKV